MADCIGSSNGGPRSGWSMKKRVNVFSILVSLIFFIVLGLVLYFKVIPKGINDTYRSHMKFENVKVSQVNLFPDNSTDLAFVIEGDLIHPPSFWGYDGTFHTWKFLDKEGELVFSEQTFKEIEHPTNKTKKKFISEIRVKDFKSKKAVSLNPVFNELTQPPKKGSKDLIEKIQLVGNFGHSSDVAVDIPVSLLQTAFKHESTSQDNIKADIDGLRLKTVVLTPTEKGLQILIAYSTNENITSFRFKKGKYPVFYSTVPVLVLILKEDLVIEQNMSRASITIDLQFVEDYVKTGSFLITELGTGLIRGETNLDLQRPTSNLQREWTSFMQKDLHTPIIEFPKFMSLVDVISTHLNQTQPHVSGLNIIDNRVELEMQLKFPVIFPVTSFAVDLGAKFKLHSKSELFVEVEVSNLYLGTIEEHQFVDFNISFIFPQSVAGMNTLKDLYETILKPHIPLEIRISEIIFFQTPSSSVSVSAAMQPFVCAWCDKLFANDKRELPLVSDDLNFEASLVSWISKKNENDEHKKSPFFFLSDLSVALIPDPFRFSVNAVLDITQLDMKHLQLPFTQFDVSYENASLGTLSLPKGLQSQNSLFRSKTISLNSEFLVLDNPDVRSGFNALFKNRINSNFDNENAVIMKGLSLGQSEMRLSTFDSFSFSIPLPELAQLSQRFLSWDFLEKKAPSEITVSSLHLTILDQFTCYIDINLNVNPPLNFALDLGTVSFTLSLSNLIDFQLTIPRLTIPGNKANIYHYKMRVKSKVNYPSVFNLLLSHFSRLPEERCSFPTPLTLKNLYFHKIENVFSPASQPSFPQTLQSFSEIVYDLDLNTLRSLSVKGFPATFEESLKAFELIGFTLEKMQLTEETVSLELNVEYSLDLPVSLEFGNPITFDVYLLGRKLGDVEILGFKLVNAKNLKTNFNIYFRPNPYWLEKNDQAVKCNLQPTTLLGICNLLGNNDMKYWKSFPAISPLFELSEEKLSLVLNMLMQKINEFDFSRLHGFEILYLLLDQIEDYVVEQLFAAPSDLKEKLLAILFSLLLKEPTSNPLFKLELVKTQLRGTKLRFAIHFESSPLNPKVEDLVTQMNILNQYQTLLDLKIEISSFKTTQENTIQGYIHIEIEFKDIDLVQLNPSLRSLLNKDDVDSLRKRSSTLLEDAVIADGMFSTPWKIKLVNVIDKEGNEMEFGELIPERLQQSVFSSSLKLLNHLAIEFLQSYAFDPKNPEFTKPLITPILDASLERKLNAIDGTGELSPVVDFHFKFNTLLPFIFEMDIADAALDIFINKTHLGILSLTNFRCYDCVRQGVKFKLQLDVLDTSSTQDAISNFIDAIMYNASIPLVSEFKNFRLHPLHPDKMNVLCLLFTRSISSEMIINWIDGHDEPSESPSTEQKNVPLPKDPYVQDVKAQRTTFFTTFKNAATLFSSPEIRIHSVALFAQDSERVQLATRIETLIIKEGKVDIDGMKLIIQFPGEDASILMNMDFILTHFELGQLDSFPAFQTQPMLHLFSSVLLDLPYLIEKKWFPHDQALADRIAKARYSYPSFSTSSAISPLHFKAKLMYDQPTTQTLPNVEINYSLNKNQALNIQVTNSFHSRHEQYDGLGVSVKLDETVHPNQEFYFEEPHEGRRTSSFSFFLDSIHFMTPTDPHRVIFSAKKVALYCDEAMLFTMIHAHDLWSHSLTTSLPFHRQEDIDVNKLKPYVTITESDAKISISASLYLHRFLPFDLDMKYLSFELTHVPWNDPKKPSPRSWKIQVMDSKYTPTQSRFVFLVAEVEDLVEQDETEINNDVALSNVFEEDLWILQHIEVGSNPSEAKKLHGLRIYKLFSQLSVASFQYLFVPEGRASPQAIWFSKFDHLKSEIQLTKKADKIHINMAFQGTNQIPLDPSLPTYELTLVLRKKASAFLFQFMDPPKFEFDRFFFTSHGILVLTKEIDASSTLKDFNQVFHLISTLISTSNPSTSTNLKNLNLGVFQFPIDSSPSFQFSNELFYSFNLKEYLFHSLIENWSQFHFTAKDEHYLQFQFKGQLKQKLGLDFNVPSLILQSDWYFQDQYLGKFGLKDLQVKNLAIQGTLYLIPGCDFGTVFTLVLSRSDVGYDFKNAYYSWTHFTFGLVPSSSTVNMTSVLASLQPVSFHDQVFQLNSLEVYEHTKWMYQMMFTNQSILEKPSPIFSLDIPYLQFHYVHLETQLFIQHHHLSILNNETQLCFETTNNDLVMKKNALLCNFALGASKEKAFQFTGFKGYLYNGSPLFQHLTKVKSLKTEDEVQVCHKRIKLEILEV